MKVPLAWLAEYVPLTLPPAELAHRLTMAGIEATHEPGASAGWDNVVVGHVLKVEPHPNADWLRLATVDVGGTVATVVCGAPNVAEGQRIAFAQVGARLFSAHGGDEGQRMELEAATIRGVVSAGMVCSERELGLGNDHTGILVLPDHAPVGKPLAEYLSDDALDLEVTTNRVDCLSVLGVAREVAAITGATVTEPSLDYDEAGPDINQSVAVRIENPELCSRFLATVVRGVQVGPSPQWMQQRLTQAGLRPINNVVDVTNFVMMEYGQPLHAFDLHTVRQGTIVVRPAKPGEPFTTLDGATRTLNPPMLLIADPERGIALAGVMGGGESEMTDATTDVLLESATFDGLNTRRTAQALKMRTEASARFEKGLNAELAMRAVRRATALILQTAGGQADTGIAEAFPNPQRQEPVRLRSDRLAQVMGMAFPSKQVSGVLKSLGFAVTTQRGALLATPPYWRSDVHVEEDLIEEVARIVGYDTIPSTPLAGQMPDHLTQPLRELREQVKDLLVSAGMQEVVSYSLVSHALLEQSAAIDHGQPEPLRVANPMSREQEYLRTTLRGGLLRTMAGGLRQPPGSLRLFEVGRVYLHRLEELPEERELAFGAMAGPRGESLWSKEAASLDFYDAKGVLEGLLERLGLNPVFEHASDPLFHPGRTATASVNGHVVGLIGELHPQAVESFDLPVQVVACFELDLERLLAELPEVEHQYQPFSRFPTADRDLALVVDEPVTADQLQRILEGHPLVRRAVLFDLFSGSPLPPGKKSLAYRVELQSDSGTLSAEQLNEAMAELVQRLEREAGASLRS